MVVVLIVVIWVAVLAAMGFRRLAERQADTSVRRYRTQTRTLRRVQPVASNIVASDEGVLDPPMAARQRINDRATRSRNAALRARRRRTLAVLLGTIVGALVLGAIPTLRVLWDLAIFATVVTGIYVALLIQIARTAAYSAERNRKVVPLRLVPPTFGYDEERVAQAGGSAFVPSRSGYLPPARPAFVLVEAPS